MLVSFCERYRRKQRVSTKQLQDAFAGRISLLEIGTGSGIDAARILKAGFDVMGIEPSSALIDESQMHFPELKGRIVQAALPLREELLKFYKTSFDAILCNAVFMHLAKENWSESMRQLAQLLKPKGRLLLTVSLDRGGLDAEHRDEFGRLYVPIKVGELEVYFDGNGLNLINQWEHFDKWKRSGLIWNSYVAEKP